MNLLVILERPAYGDERAYDGLRLAGNLAKHAEVDVRIFSFGDAVGCAVAGQQLPNGLYYLDRMITAAAHHGAVVGLGGSCMDARGITNEMVIADARRSSLDEVTDWALRADTTITCCSTPLVDGTPRCAARAPQHCERSERFPLHRATVRSHGRAGFLPAPSSPIRPLLWKRPLRSMM